MKPRTKPKTSDKPATPRKVSIARLVQSSEPNIDDEAEERARGGVQSLGRAFSILEEVARHREGIGLADLSKRVGLHNSTTFHLAKTLVSLGYLRQERDSKRYRVGRPLFALAASALDEIEMVNLATPILEDLSRESGESGHFAVRMGDAVIVIARTSGPGAFQLTDRVGVVRPGALHRARQDHAGLAAPRSVQALSRTGRTEAVDEKVDHRPAVLLRDIAEIRRSAIAFDDGEFNAEVRCVAVPVYNFTGEVIGALGISGPIWRHDRPGAAEPRQAGAIGRRPAVGRVRRAGSREILLIRSSLKSAPNGLNAAATHLALTGAIASGNILQQ